MAIVFESIQVMDGDDTDYIPDLLLAEEANEIDAVEANKEYGIESIFKIRCEVMDVNQMKQPSDEEMSSDQEDSTLYREEGLRLAFIIPSNRAISLLD